MAALTMSVCGACMQSMRRSVESLATALEQSTRLEALAESFPQLLCKTLGGRFDVLPSFGEALVGGSHLKIAGGASQAVLGFECTQLLRELMAALASEFDVAIVDVHGWPVLSFVCGNANVTDAEALKKGLGGGFPHNRTEGEA